MWGPSGVLGGEVSAFLADFSEHEDSFKEF